MHLHPVVWLIVIHPLLLRIVHVHVLLLLVAIVILLRWHVHHIIALHLVIRPAHHIVLHHHWIVVEILLPPSLDLNGHGRLALDGHWVVLHVAVPQSRDVSQRSPT